MMQAVCGPRIDAKLVRAISGKTGSGGSSSNAFKYVLCAPSISSSDCTNIPHLDISEVLDWITRTRKQQGLARNM